MTATAKRAELIAGRENKSCDTFFPSTEPCEIQYLPPTDVREKKIARLIARFRKWGKNSREDSSSPPLFSFSHLAIWEDDSTGVGAKKFLLLLHAVCNLAKSLFIGEKRKRRRSLTFSSPLNHTSKTHKRWWNDGKAFGKQRISRCKIANKKICNLSKVKFWANKTA